MYEMRTFSILQSILLVKVGVSRYLSVQTDIDSKRFFSKVETKLAKGPNTNFVLKGQAMILSSLRLHICICIWAQELIFLTRQSYKQCLFRKKKKVYHHVGDIK